ncbi:MAG TPA: hypothetical protein VMT71_15140 [Syntrophorhabdales bacterium]|nr:hypothetical protein [Syntrophorhabdales bacterium]
MADVELILEKGQDRREDESPIEIHEPDKPEEKKKEETFASERCEARHKVISLSRNSVDCT